MSIFISCKTYLLMWVSTMRMFIVNIFMGWLVVSIAFPKGVCIFL